MDAGKRDMKSSLKVYNKYTYGKLYGNKNASEFTTGYEVVKPKAVFSTGFQPMEN